MVELSSSWVIETSLDTTSEDELEMELLADISHDNDTVSLHGVNSMVKGSHISGIIVESSITLSDNQGYLLLWNKDANSVLVFLGNTSSNEILNHGLEHRVVEALTNFLKGDIKSIVDLLEFFSGSVTENLPALKAVIVTSLELDNVLVGGLLETFVAVEVLFGLLVEGLKISDVDILSLPVRESSIKFSNKHTELSAPVTDVVNTLNVPAKELEAPADGLTLNGRS
jgi:hypothetical protein